VLAASGISTAPSFVVITILVASTDVTSPERITGFAGFSGVCAAAKKADTNTSIPARKCFVAILCICSINVFVVNLLYAITTDRVACHYLKTTILSVWLYVLCKEM